MCLLQRECYTEDITQPAFELLLSDDRAAEVREESGDEVRSGGLDERKDGALCITLLECRVHHWLDTRQSQEWLSQWLEWSWIQRHRQVSLCWMLIQPLTA